jgi:hypothetical protein
MHLQAALAEHRSHYRVPFTVDELQAVLERAGAAELGLLVRGTRPAGYGSGMPSVVQDPMDAYGWDPMDMPIASPSARRISQMTAAFALVSLIPLTPAKKGSGMLASYSGGAVLRRIVLARSYVDPRTGRHRFSWKRLADYLHCSPTSVKAWHKQALETILRELHKRQPGQMLGFSGLPH